MELGLVDRVAVESIEDADALRLLGLAAHAIGDEVRCADLPDRAVGAAPGRRTTRAAAPRLRGADPGQQRAGYWRTAAAAAEEGRRLAAETGQPRSSASPRSRPRPSTWTCATPGRSWPTTTRRSPCTSTPSATTWRAGRWPGPRLELRLRRLAPAAATEHRARAPTADDVLSPQEMQIARLAADGLSNREIGQRLYLSHRTVGSHLYRMFPKLGITSRSQLGARLDA